MPRFVHNALIVIRRAVLAVLLKLPQGVRTFLAQNRLLTRVFIYFDAAKYMQMMRTEKYDYRNDPVCSEAHRLEMDAFAHKPLISIIMPVYNVDPAWLKRAIESVENQWYERWELCIADDNSSTQATLDLLRSIDHPKIKISFLDENGNISVASNQALRLATGEYVALMDHDDELTPDALFEAVKAINQSGAEFIYSDEDKLELDGTYSDPHFKPDFSPDMFLSINYFSHLGVIRKSLIDQVGGFTPGLEGAQDYDLYLRVLEHTDRVVHIPRVLYHWRKVSGSTAAIFEAKSYADEAGVRALQNAVGRRRLKAEVLRGQFSGTYRLKYEIDGDPLISIVIPFRDKVELLTPCVESILQKSTWQHFEVIGISNDSREEATFAEMQRLAALDDRVSFHEHNHPFNYSEINNYAVGNIARGEHIVLLNNDIEIITSDWLESLLEYSQRDDIAVVGAKLYYPDDRVQHAGVIIGVRTLAGHSHQYYHREHHGYFSRLCVAQNLSALTAACCMVKKSVYEELGGLDQDNLKVAFNDIDFCLRAREAGYLNVYTPHCEAYHFESQTRGSEDTGENRLRFRKEVEYMWERHADILEKGDPYYNPNLTLEAEDFGLRE
jgi:GT2 family glycosyltransferase